MRFLFVTTTSATAHAFLLPFARHLRQSRHDVEFACSTDTFVDAPSQAKKLCEAGFKLHDIPFARQIDPLEDLKALWSLAHLIRAQHYDLVHTQTSKAGFIGRLAARLANAPIVVHTAYDYYFRAYRSGPKHRLFVSLEKIAAFWCDAILFISEPAHAEALRYRLKDQAKLALVGHGIEVADYVNFSTDAGAVRAKYGIAASTPWVGSIGRLVENKGIDVFLKAAALVLNQRPDVRFVVAGDGPLRKDLKRMAMNLGIDGRVQFAGYLPTSQDVMRLMASLDVFVLPTRREGLGVVYLEAMALQRPVVGSRIAPVTNVILDGETGFLATVDDPEAFAQAILVLLNDPRLCQRMGAAGRRHVQQSFDSQQVFERTKLVYRNLLNAKGHDSTSLP